jgi:hypothetical protein
MAAMLGRSQLTHQPRTGQLAEAQRFRIKATIGHNQP